MTSDVAALGLALVDGLLERLAGDLLEVQVQGQGDLSPGPWRLHHVRLAGNGRAHVVPCHDFAAGSAPQEVVEGLLDPALALPVDDARPPRPARDHRGG